MHEALGAQVDVRGLARMESRAALRAVLRAWLPLAEAVLGMSVEVLPHPRDAAPLRTPHLLPQISTTLQLPPATQEVSNIPCFRQNPRKQTLG